MSGPVKLNDDGIFIDMFCSQIKLVGSCICVPLKLDWGLHNEEYRKELNEFLKKWWDKEFDLRQE